MRILGCISAISACSSSADGNAKSLDWAGLRVAPLRMTMINDGRFPATNPPFLKLLKLKLAFPENIFVEAARIAETRPCARVAAHGGEEPRVSDRHHVVHFPRVSRHGAAA